jgi:hypothetical protein
MAYHLQLEGTIGPPIVVLAPKHMAEASTLDTRLPLVHWKWKVQAVVLTERSAKNFLMCTQQVDNSILLDQGCSTMHSVKAVGDLLGT